MVLPILYPYDNATTIGLVLALATGQPPSFVAPPLNASSQIDVVARYSFGPGQLLIPGVISHATNVVEHPELVAERIVRLAKIIGRDNVIAGTDCGFAQGPFVQRVHPSIMWAKLRALVAGARIASKRLWTRRAAA